MSVRAVYHPTLERGSGTATKPTDHKYLRLKDYSSVTDAAFNIQSGSGDRSIIAIIEAGLSAPEIPESAGFHGGQNSGYFEVATGTIALQTQNSLRLWLQVVMALQLLWGRLLR